MGFGFLLYGYLMMLDFGISTMPDFNLGFDAFPDIVGYIFFFIALKKLSPYSQGFRNARIVSIFLLALGSVTLCAQALSFFGKYGETLALILDICSFARLIIFTLFNAFLLWGVRSLAKRVNLPKIERRAIALLIISLLSFTIRTSVYAFSFTDAERAFLTLLFSIIWYVQVFFSMYTMFNCYMYICYEGEEQIVVPESKLTAFVKRLKK